MASPVAHSLAGAAIYLASRRRREWRATELGGFIVAANLADLDLVPGLLVGDHALFHRKASHSMLGAMVFASFILLICRWHGTMDPVRTTVLLSTAYLSQLLLDWLSLDNGPPAGIQLFWPFSKTHYMADPTIFLNIERSNPLTYPVIIHNAKAVLLEVALLGPVVLASWWWWKFHGISRGALQRQNP